MSAPSSWYHGGDRTAPPADECGVVRAGTLGYQRCWLPCEHTTLHKSQDGREWGDGWMVGDLVKVGTGKHVWRIDEITELVEGRDLVRLERADRRDVHTTVESDRLHPAPPPNQTIGGQ